MREWWRTFWIEKVIWPHRRRQIRKGTMALVYLDARMKKVGWKRQQRRSAFNSIYRTPSQAVWILDLIYNERGLRRPIK